MRLVIGDYKSKRRIETRFQSFTHPAINMRGALALRNKPSPKHHLAEDYLYPGLGSLGLHVAGSQQNRFEAREAV